MARVREGARERGDDGRGRELAEACDTGGHVEHYSRIIGRRASMPRRYAERMRATLLYGPGDVRWEEVPDPVIADPRNAIVRVVAACVCGSDLWHYRGVTPAPSEPKRIGHEFVGIVEEVGADVSRVKPGDFVIAPFYDCDMTCDNCRYGFSTSCRELCWWG
ncbi:hypothetical protein GCM10010921_18670 [Microbacterium album]|uniref:Alcohol dehydrogenase-like N-terminal domain-containing protein n=1 Tax=Microbacterium album TaxID=2053191 RepID=A0A917IFA2_9MICO|nr:hypothetical protein GCM10010921_18670 [Microbacterium album]